MIKIIYKENFGKVKTLELKPENCTTEEQVYELKNIINNGM